MFSTEEIQKRVQNQYMERVGARLRRMRKLLMDRNWDTLKSEAHQLADGAQNFGYPELVDEVNRSLEVLNKQNLTRTTMDPEAKAALETLFKRLDRFLAQQVF